MIERTWPTLLVVAACLGFVLSNALTLPDAVLFAALLVFAGAVAVPHARLPALALAVAVAGWGWGS
ncbi:MAG: hypothetical protein H0T61_01330, partial [Actinobacteria bacterium]|nr:hypothetical protein [Actinomycetota bacterium]